MHVQGVGTHCRRINKPIEEGNSPSLVQLIGVSPERARISLAGTHGRWHFACRESKVVEKVVKANKKGDAGRRAVDEMYIIMKSKMNKWNCVVILMNEVKRDKSFTCLQDIAEELNISRHIINDIVNDRKKNNKYENSIYYPKIKITEIEKEKRTS